MLEKIGGEKRGGQATRINSSVSEPGERACCDRSDLVAPEKNFTFASNRISRSQQTKERTSEPPLFRERRNGGQREGTHTCGGSLFVRLLSIALISLRRHSGPNINSGHTLSTHRGRRTSLTAFELFFDAGCLT